MRTHPGFKSIALLVVSIALFCAVLPVRAEERGPAEVIREFYQWYVQTLNDAGDPFKSGDADLKRYATTRLVGEIEKMRNGPDGLDADYFLDAQDFDKEWAKNIKVSTPKITGDKATAAVELSGSEMGKKQLDVSLAREKGVWKVDKVAGK